MPRNVRIKQDVLARWFAQTATRKSKYTHRLLKEDVAERASALPFLKQYVSEAHADAQRKLAKAANPTLSPFKVGAAPPEVLGYPDLLHINVQKGYLGEVLAGLAAEHFDVHGKSDWKVPLFLFRYHGTAFEFLERLRPLSRKQRTALQLKQDLPGRTGDDALAFRLTKGGRISATLVCEAKCRNKMSSDGIEKAHKKLGRLDACPSGVLQLMQALQDYDTPNAKRWVSALYGYRERGFRKRPKYCLLLWARNGKRPKPRLPRSGPHKSYAGTAPLEAIEMVFVGLTGFVKSAYSP